MQWNIIQLYKEGNPGFGNNMDGAGGYNSKLNKKEKVSMISLIC